jgi:hypothetical protein
LVFIAGQEPEDDQGNLVVAVTWKSRPVKCLPKWAVHSRLPVPAPST